MIFDYQVTIATMELTGEIQPRSVRDKILMKKLKKYGRYK